MLQFRALHQPWSWWQRLARAGESNSPPTGSLCGLHSEVRFSQRDFITLFSLVENFRTSHILYWNTRTKTRLVIGAALPSARADAGRGLQFAQCWALGLIAPRLFNMGALLGGGGAGARC